MHRVQVALVFFVLIGSVVFAQNEKDQMAAQQKAWMEYAAPGKMHKILAERVGKWKTHTEMWMQPGSEPMESEGSAEYKMILGGRYLKSWHKGVSMGMPFEGMSIEAYDNSTKEFITTWIDSFGTGVTVSKGHYYKDKKMIKAKGAMVDPMSGKDIMYRTVGKKINKDKFIFEMYMPMPDGKEVLTMRMTYVRVE